MFVLSQDKKKLLVNIAITLCYAIFTFLIVQRHEIWTDEAQVWQVAKCLSVPELFKHLVNEGHPSLFYLLVMPFAKTGCSVFSMQILCWLSSVSAVFVLLHFSPFKWWCNLSIILSCGFLYSFPVNTRSYSIIPILVFLAAILYLKHKEKPVLYAIVLFLLAHTHIIMYGFVGVLTLLFVYENYKEKSWSKKNIISILIMLSALFLVFLQLHGTQASNDYINQSVISYKLITNFKKVIFDFITLSIYNIPIKHFFWLHYIFISILAGLFILLFKKSKKIFCICCLSVLFQFTIYTIAYAYTMYETRIFCAYIILIFGFWIAEIEVSKDKLNSTFASILLSIFFLLTTVNGIIQCTNDYLYNYSTSKDTAKYIQENISPQDIILCCTPHAFISIIPYIKNNYSIYEVPDIKKVSYITWKKDLIYSNTSQDWEIFLDNFVSSTKELLNGRRIFVIQTVNYFQPIKNTNIVFIEQNSIAKNQDFVILEYIYEK